MARRPPSPPRARRAHRRRRVAASAVVAVLVGVLPAPAPTAAQEGGGTDPAPPAPAPPADGLDALDQARQLLPEHLRGVPAVSSALSRAEARVRALEATILENRRIRDAANLELVGLAADRDVQRTAITTQRERRLVAGVRAEQLRGELADLAVAAYVGGGRAEVVLPLDAAASNDANHQQALVDAADETLRERLAAAEADVAEAAAAVESARSTLATIVATIDEVRARRDAAEAELAAAEPAMGPAQEAYRDAFMLAEVADVELLSVVAFDAYRTAAASQPACRLPWTVLGGIGRVESRHGTYGGARPGADGTTSPRIIGIALDGRPGIATIRDTDGGAFDGDATYDRAVGPMQFIPSTWRAFRRDGNGDGQMDPHNLYDAAAAAASYLCRSNGALDDAGNLNRAILSYNQSQAYVDAVLGHRRDYDRLGLG